VVVAVAIFLGTRSPSVDQNELASPLIGTRAPDFVTTTLDNNTWRLSEHRGEVVVLNFWASWCDPCVTEAPELSSFAWSQRNNKVQVLGVVFNDSLSAARGFESHYGSLYPSVTDNRGEIANSFGVTSPPTTIVIDRQGVISSVMYGATNTWALGEAVAEATT
jgi:peroxiredoxin